ncbi:hypothetical protein [Vibrio mangrovi]|uniref:Uncharacterized protein n=1 Tax=Vibrio mangrovi TaxID=474394 RepID=A0A1Y6ITC6_9VIBR|nr:hypothetical protein [Vibrio mangrovi]MDW6004639.1 hypothetical protein [Vibrio mangrovi]SMS00929.1 hypothetical protein VIM7927_02202 [Vibrio mangrovi]
MDTVNHAHAFSFKNFTEFQHEASHLNTNALLRQGHMNIGGTRYNVSLVDDKISVAKDPQVQSKMKRFFNGASGFFKQHLGDSSSSNRSGRIADSLNYRRSVEMKSAQFSPSSSQHSSSQYSSRPGSGASSPSSSGYFSAGASSFGSASSGRVTPESSPSRPAHSQAQSRPQVNSGYQTSSGSQTNSGQKLNFDDFMRMEEDRAEQANEYPSEALARADYERYRRQNQPASAQQTKPGPTQGFSRPDSPTHDLNHFMKAEEARADYYGEVPNRADAEAVYQQQASHRPSSGSGHGILRPGMGDRPMKTRPETTGGREELQRADYYGHSASLSKWDRIMMEAESSSGTSGLSRHQSAPSVLQTETAAPHKPGRREQIYNSIQGNIERLPRHEQKIPKETLNVFAQMQPNLTHKSQREVLTHISDAMKLPTAQRNEQLKNLQQVLQDSLTGGRR